MSSAQQTSYLIKAPVATAGILADSAPGRIASRFNEETTDYPAGIGIANGTNDDGGKLPASLTTALFAGVVVNSQAKDPSGLTTGAYLTKTQMPVLEKGVIWVSPEEAVTPGSNVYMRVATSVVTNTLTQKGAFRATPDGVAAVVTVTPTAVNSAQYGIEVLVQVAGGYKRFQFYSTGDGTATATEICNDWRTSMAADPEFTALVVASGTTTLILTGQVAGMTIVVNATSDTAVGAIAIVATTPAAPTAILLNGCQYLDTCAAGQFARLSVDVNAVRQL